MLKCNSINVHCKFGARQSENRLAVWVILVVFERFR